MFRTKHTSPQSWYHIVYNSFSLLVSFFFSNACTPNWIITFFSNASFSHSEFHLKDDLYWNFLAYQMIFHQIHFLILSYNMNCLLVTYTKKEILTSWDNRFSFQYGYKPKNVNLWIFLAVFLHSSHFLFGSTFFGTKCIHHGMYSCNSLDILHHSQLL